MDLVPPRPEPRSEAPAHGPARRWPAEVAGLIGDDLPHDLDSDPDDDPDDGPQPSDAGPPPALPDVVEAVTGRARDLHRLADELTGAEDLPAVALLRAHAGAVDDLAEHLLAAGSAGEESERPDAGPGGRDRRAHGPRGPG